MNGIKNNHNLTYKTAISKEEKKNIILAFVVPCLVFFFALFTIAHLGNYGRLALTPFIVTMWIMGIVVAVIMPSFRKQVSKETLAWIVAYCAAMIGLKWAVYIMSGVNSATLASTFSVTIPETSGNTAIGMMQNVFVISSWGIPVSFYVYQMQRVIRLRKNINIKKAFKRERDIRDTNQNFY